MRTKQETIEYCKGEMNDAARIISSEKEETRRLAIGIAISTYQDVIDFLEDEDEHENETRDN